MKLLRSLVVLLLALASVGAFALTQCTQWTAYQNPSESHWTTKPGALAQWQALNPPPPGVTRSNFQDTPTGYSYHYQIGCCESGTSYIVLASRTGTYCSSCVAPSGTVETRNVTYGFSGKPPVPGGTAYLDFLPNGQPNAGGGIPNPPATACIQSCIYNLTGETGDVWASTMATANGHYRVSRDVTYTSTGTECEATQSDKEVFDQTMEPPACNGSSGYFNGKKVCLPSVPDSGVKFPTGAYKEGNPKSASKPEDGAARLPVTGNGGNAGGPAGQRDGVTVFPGGVIVEPTPSTPASGTKTSTPGEEQVACGAPGQPKCAIDETGTPNGQGVFNTASAGIDTEKTSALNAITSAKNLQNIPWSWSFQLPTGCTALALPAFDLSIDVCQWQPMIHDIMSIAWIMATVFFGLGIVRRAL